MFLKFDRVGLQLIIWVVVSEISPELDLVDGLKDTSEFFTLKLDIGGLNVGATLPDLHVQSRAKRVQWIPQCVALVWVLAVLLCVTSSKKWSVDT
jgi:hypothetical protein